MIVCGMEFGALMTCLAWLVLGAMAIMFAVHDYLNKRYFSFGLNIMFTVVFATYMVRILLRA